MGPFPSSESLEARKTAVGYRRTVPLFSVFAHFQATSLRHSLSLSILASDNKRKSLSKTKTMIQTWRHLRWQAKSNGAIEHFSYCSTATASGARGESSLIKSGYQSTYLLSRGDGMRK